jgi:cadmium resistance protein CadD (predicted permease)
MPAFYRGEAREETALRFWHSVHRGRIGGMNERQNDLRIVIVTILGALGIIATVFLVSFLLAIALQEMVIGLVGVILATMGIFYLIQWFNRRDDPRTAKHPPDQP